MRACRLLLPVLLVATGLLPAPAIAQAEPAPRGWWSRVFPRTTARAPQTLMLRDAATIMRRDQRRETILEETAAARRMAADKQRLLLELRSERDRRVSVAIARAAATRPFPTPENDRLATTQTTAAKTSEQPGAQPPPAPPPFVPSPDRERTVAEKAAETVDRAIDNLGQKLFNTPTAERLPPGLFALALIGMFLTPALGVGLLLIGIAHWRGRSFVPGTVILVLGVLILWGTWFLAKTINPNLLTGSSEDTRRATANPE